VSQGKPVLGVCRGAQLINIAEGGSLFQDVHTMHAESLLHRDQQAYDTLGHPIKVVADELLAPLFAGYPHAVNSVHHQGFKRLGSKLKPLAHAPDGLVEAFRRDGEAGESWVIAVQWHPEWMPDAGPQRALFEAFIDAARGATQ
jgi:putative glutamine amidotransferase